MSFTASLLQIGKGAPPPVYVFYMPPAPQLMPPGVVKKAYENETFRLSMTGVENLSSRVLSGIRIKLAADPAYPPQHLATDTRRPPVFSYDQGRNEIRVESLDPGEKAYFGLFYRADVSPPTGEPTVIIGDRQISRSMQLLGFAKRHPRPAFSVAFSCLVTALTVITVAVFLLLPKYVAPDKVLLDGVAKDFGTCEMVVLDKDEASIARLESSKVGLNVLLQFNRVSSLPELLAKDKVVSCE